MSAPTPPAIESVAPSRIAEVAAAVKALKALEDWKGRHPEAYAELVEVASILNPAVRAGDKAVRTRLVSSGPYELYQWRRKDNAKALMDAVGRQKFASLGGVITPVENLTLERERFDLAVAQERVDPELVKSIVRFEAAFHTPDEIVIPGPAPDPGAAHLRRR